QPRATGGPGCGAAPRPGPPDAGPWRFRQTLLEPRPLPRPGWVPGRVGRAAGDPGTDPRSPDHHPQLAVERALCRGERDDRSVNCAAWEPARFRSKARTVSTTP